VLIIKKDKSAAYIYQTSIREDINKKGFHDPYMRQGKEQKPKGKKGEGRRVSSSVR